MWTTTVHGNGFDVPLKSPHLWRFTLETSLYEVQCILVITSTLIHINLPD